MVRVELLMSVLAGFAGGLVGVLWGGLVSAGWLSGERTALGGVGREESAGRLVAVAALYGACGASLGFLFWLSWGLIALVQAPWIEVGLLFGVLCWAGGALPALGMLSLRLDASRRVTAVFAVEWLVSCLAIGLLCALSWHRAG